jgi:spore coat polysaccharide biosynthesis protein SpsF
VDLSAHRWTVDEPADLAFVRRVYEVLDRGDGLFATSEVLELLGREPGLRGLNDGIGRDEGYAKSLREDTIVPVPVVEDVKE